MLRFFLLGTFCRSRLCQELYYHKNDWIVGPQHNRWWSNYQRHVLPIANSEKKFLAETIHVSQCSLQCASSNLLSLPRQTALPDLVRTYISCSTAQLFWATASPFMFELTPNTEEREPNVLPLPY